MTMHDHVTSCIAHERLRVEYGLVRKSCMNHARTCKIFLLGLDGHLDSECSCERVTCPAEGCGALVPRGEMDTHQQFFCLQSCPNSKPKAVGSDGDEQDTCDIRLSRNDLIDHLKYHCRLRPTHCPHASCEVFTAFNRMPAHIEICPYAPVSCPLLCGAPAITRQSIDAHMRGCPRKPVSCIHAPLGCSHVAPRDQITQHEQDIGSHFMALSKAFVQLQQSHEQQILQMQQMFEEKLNKQSVLIEQLQTRVAMFVEDLHHLQPIVIKAKAKAEAAKGEAEAAKAKAKAEAEAAKARVLAEIMADEVMRNLRCYKCIKPAVVFFKNDMEPQRNDSLRIHGFSGACSSFTHVYFGSQWGVGLRSKIQIVEKITAS